MTSVSEAPTMGRNRWMIPAAISLSGAPMFLGYVLPRPILPAIQTALAAGPEDHYLVKLIMIAFVGGLIVGSPAAGFLLERTSYRRLLGGAGLLFVAAGCSGYLISDLRLLVASRFVAGAAAAALNITAVTMAGDLYDANHRARWIGMITATGSLFAILSSPVAGFAGSVAWRLPFLLHMLALPIVLLALGMRPVAPHRSERATAASAARTRFPRAMLILALVVGIMVTLPSMYMAFRMRDIGILSPAVIGVMFLAASVPETIISALYGAVRSRLGARLVFLIGFGLAGGGLAILASIGTRFGLIGGMLVYGLGNGLLAANMMNLAASVDAHRSRIVGVVLSAYCTASVVGVLVLESLFRGSPASAPLLVMAAGCVLAAVYYYAMFNRSLNPARATA